MHEPPGASASRSAETAAATRQACQACQACEDALALRRARLRFEALLRQSIYVPCSIVWTANRVRLASCAWHQGRLKLRLHRLFAGGSAQQAADLVAMLLHGQRMSAARLKLWFAAAVQHAEPAPSQAPMQLPAAPQGAPAACPELAEILASLNVRYFHHGCKASIRWGRAGHSPRRHRRSMQLGCYDFERREIRIHPALRQSFVPAFVVELVVYHEMLHEVFGLERRGHRRVMHPPAFRACEQSHPDYARARAWEAQNLPRLLGWRA